MEVSKAWGLEQILDVELQVGHARNDFFYDPLSGLQIQAGIPIFVLPGWERRTSSQPSGSGRVRGTLRSVSWEANGQITAHWATWAFPLDSFGHQLRLSSPISGEAHLRQRLLCLAESGECNCPRLGPLRGSH
jgi:hypothetical protein